MKPPRPDANSGPMSPSKTLRSAIAPFHVAIEELPVAKAMVTGTITREAYGELLCRLENLHAVVEDCADAALTDDVFTPSMRRLEAVRRDRTSLGLAEGGAGATANALIGRYLSELVTAVAEDPAAMVGPLYVLEGSRMGSMVLHKPMAKALGVTSELGQGLDYHIEGMKQTPMRFMALKGQIDQMFKGNPNGVTAAARAAAATMELLHSLYAQVNCTAGATATATAAANDANPSSDQSA